VVEDQRDPDQDQREGREGDGAAHEQAQALLEPAADRAGAETEEQRDGQEDAEGDQAEADQLPRLGVVARPAARGLRGATATALMGDLRADLTPPGCATNGRTPASD
jgi:hypothetical protein